MSHAVSKETLRPRFVTWQKVGSTIYVKKNIARLYFVRHIWEMSCSWGISINQATTIKRKSNVRARLPSYIWIIEVVHKNKINIYV